MRSRKKKVEPRGGRCQVSPAQFEEATSRARGEVAEWISFLRASGSEGPRLAVQSYPDETDGVSTKSYLYDNGLALLWYTWIGEMERAGALARTLVAHQREDGSWGFSLDFSTEEPRQSRRVRTGAVAWAAHGLNYYARQSGDGRARSSVERAVSFLIDERYSADDPSVGGLIGPGRWVGGSTPRIAVTEHQIDVHMLLREIAPSEGDRLRRRVLDRLWMPDEGRFAVAAHREGLDRKRALDAAGAWSSLWLDSISRPSLARRSFAYVLRTFRVRDAGLVGYRPYVDVFGQYDELDRPHVFTEGSFGVGLAGLRLGHDLIARRMLRLGVEMNCRAGPGIPYSNFDLADFSDHPAAASSLWFLFLEREWRTGRTAPIFTETLRAAGDSDRRPRTSLLRSDVR